MGNIKPRVDNQQTGGLMPNTEVEFEETERRLLDWLEAHAIANFDRL
jgi:hypothetical protein